MKIGIVLSRPPSYSETFFISKIKGLQSHGYEVILFVQNSDSEFKLCKVVEGNKGNKKDLIKLIYGAIKCIFIAFKNVKRTIRFIKFERRIRANWLIVLRNVYINMHILSKKLDWLHFGFATMALGRENTAKAIGAKMAVSLRGFDMAIYPLKKQHCYNFLWVNVDKIHSISNDLYVLALKLGLSSTKAYQKITPAININLFKNDDHKNYGNPIRILTVGRLHWKKGYSDTLYALKQLKDEGVQFKYTIVGTGKEYEKLMYIRYVLGLENDVVFLWKVSHEEVKELMDQHQIYIQYSISEGFCNAVLEAQAMGLLCVVSDAEGLPENVLEGKSGWVVPKKAPEKLASKILEVHNLEMHEKKQIIDFAINRVKQEFNLDKQQKEFIEFYK